MVMEAELKDFYRGKKVLITGHTGFKGGWLALWLKMMGAELTGYALAPPGDQPNLFTVAEVGRDIDSNISDIRDLAGLKEVFHKSQPEIVFHLAAQSLVRKSYLEPVETYATNIMGTVNLLEALRQSPSVRAAVIVTSDKCYENREWLWGYRENEPLGGYDPYSSSKAGAEIVTAAYRNSFFQDKGAAVASARAGNVIGGGDWAADRLVPDIIRALSANKQIVIRNPRAVRPWQHVLEPLRGYMMLAMKLAAEPRRYAGAWNFGPWEASALPVEAIVERMIKTWSAGSWRHESDGNLHEANYLKLDSSKARSEMNWKPALSAAAAIDMTVDWYKNYYLDEKPSREFCRGQINDYLQKLNA